MTYRQLISNILDQVTDLDLPCQPFVLERDESNVAVADHMSPSIRISLCGICMEMPPSLQPKEV